MEDRKAACQFPRSGDQRAKFCGDAVTQNGRVCRGGLMLGVAKKVEE